MNEEVRKNLRDISVKEVAANDKLQSSGIVQNNGGSTSLFYSKS